MGFPLAAIPAIIGAAQAIGGGIGRSKAKRPKYEIPDSVRAATSLAALRTQEEAPGATQARADMNILAANAIAGAQQTGGAQSQLGSIVGARRNQLRDLTAATTQHQSRMMDRYEDALRVMGEYEDMEFQLNEMAPFKDQARLTEDMIGAGIQNTFNALTMDDGLFDFGIEKEVTDSPNFEEVIGRSNLQMANEPVDVDFGDMPDIDFGLQQTSLIRAIRSQKRIRPSFYDDMFSPLNSQYLY